MKKQFLFLSIILLAGGVVANAQGFPKRTVEDRVKLAHEKIDSAFKLENAKLASVDSIFIDYYKAFEKVREETMKSGGQNGFQALREKMQPFADERDSKLKALLSEDQYRIWKDQIEASLRMQRRNGGG